MRVFPLALLVIGFAGADAIAEPNAPIETDASLCNDALEGVSDQQLDPPESNQLFIRLRHAADRGCTPRLVGWLAASQCASSTTGVVAAAAFSSESMHTADMNALLENPSADCAKQLLPAVQQAARVDEGTHLAVRRFTRSSDPAIAGGAWLVLGTLETIARNGDDAKLAGDIDAELGAALDRATSENRANFLEAAGNGGCRSCAQSIATASLDADPWVRRAAAVARRFDPKGARAMCSALGDSNATVREHAAWALGLQTDEPDVRASCLGRAANGDASEDVRKSAQRSLEDLMEK